LEEEDLRNPIRIGLPEELRVAEKLRRTLLRVAGKTRRLGELVSVPQTEWPLVGAQDATEFAQLVEHLTNQGYFSEAYLRSSPWTMKVTIPGLDQAEKLSQRQVRGDRAFVAMWFTPETSAAWSQGFEPALRASGFQAIRMDRVQHNEKICDRILAEIRSSNLLVADFTGHRGGVYFEAGFAMGLGVPVVWTCRADHIEALHFDIRQYNQVVWETEIELREKLEDRVKATIPRPLGA
jgi:hypothetical protein